MEVEAKASVNRCVMMERSLRCLLTLALLFLTPAWAQVSLEQGVRQAMQAAVDEKRVAGCVVVVMVDGRTVLHEASGMADVAGSRAMGVDSLFRLASVSKPIVSAAVMKLVQEGRLSLRDPVTRWLPWFAPKSPSGGQPEITIHQLLTHTSGLSYRFAEPATSLYHPLGVSDGVDQPWLSLEENLRRLGSAPLGFEPGERFHYGLSTDVLGAVVEKVTGMGLPEATEELVLAPLGTTDTGFHAVDTARLTTPYGNTPTGLVELVDGTALPLQGGFLSVCPSKALAPSRYPSGGGGMVGSAGDVARFLDGLRSGGRGVLSQETVALMAGDRLGAGVEGHRAGWGFGYGWAVLRDPVAAGSPQSAGTWQWGGAYGHSWFVDPERKLTVVLLTNTAFEGMAGQLVRDVREAVYRGLED